MGETLRKEEEEHKVVALRTSTSHGDVCLCFFLIFNFKLNLELSILHLLSHQTEKPAKQQHRIESIMKV